MRRAVPIGVGLVLAAVAMPIWGSAPARAQWFVRPYGYYYPHPVYPPRYYPPPPVYAPAYPPPPLYAPPAYAPPVYAPAPPRPSASLMEVQRMLGELGYDPGPVDGLAGPRLSDAVQAFQRDHAESQTGRLSGETIGAIREAARTHESQGVPVPSAPLTDSPTAQSAPAAPSYAPPSYAPSSPSTRSTLSVKPSSQ